MYKNRDGVSLNTEKAVYHFSKVIKRWKQFDAAHWVLGKIYEKVSSFTDPNRALFHYRKAADLRYKHQAIEKVAE